MMSEDPFQSELFQNYPAIIMTFYYKSFSAVVKTLQEACKKAKYKHTTTQIYGPL